MKFTKIAAVAAVALAGSLGTANAAPLSGLAKAPAAEAGIVEVHRRHQSCVLPPGRGRLASYTAPGRADRVPSARPARCWPDLAFRRQAPRLVQQPEQALALIAA